MLLDYGHTEVAGGALESTGATVSALEESQSFVSFFNMETVFFLSGRERIK